MELDQLNERVTALRAELDAIKDRLAFTDELVSRRLQSSGQRLGATSPTLPHLGRFSQLGPTQAIRELFDTHPDEALSAPQIAEMLLKEGFQTESPNLSGILFTICKRLELQDEFLESFMQNNQRHFRKKKEGKPHVRLAP